LAVPLARRGVGPAQVEHVEIAGRTELQAPPRAATHRLAQVFEIAQVAGVLQRRVEVFEGGIEGGCRQTGGGRLRDEPFANAATQLVGLAAFRAILCREQRRGPFEPGLAFELGAEARPAGQVARQRNEVRETLRRATLGGERDQGRVAFAESCRGFRKRHRQLLAEQRQSRSRCKARNPVT
jgi:hypothetical protein